jgi:MarR family transcriptional regulator, lower aerobic nicotinate degradation pathway regulator
MGTKSRSRKSRQSAPPAIKTFHSSGVPVRRTLVALAHRLDQICLSAAAEGWTEAGLTPLQGGVLAYLNKVDGEPNIDQSGLAARLGVDRVSAGRLVYELEVMGLVERRVDGADRRTRRLRLTPSGEKLRARVHPLSAAAYMRVLDPLSPRERELLLDLLVRVVESNSALARPGAGRRKRGYRQSLAAKGRQFVSR